LRHAEVQLAKWQVSTDVVEKVGLAVAVRLSFSTVVLKQSAALRTKEQLFGTAAASCHEPHVF
jgi:organic hydroperoxide reductase OsmC/OhrA